MSLIIKGFIMPLMCEECPCYDCDDYSCKATGRGVIEYRYDGRPDNCPLVEIPTPHGDLIDKEPIKKFILDGINKPTPESFGYDGIEILSEIEFAPTIIEAEVSE